MVLIRDDGYQSVTLRLVLRKTTSLAQDFPKGHVLVFTLTYQRTDAAMALSLRQRERTSRQRPRMANRNTDSSCAQSELARVCPKPTAEHRACRSPEPSAARVAGPGVRVGPLLRPAPLGPARAPDARLRASESRSCLSPRPTLLWAGAGPMRRGRSQGIGLRHGAGP